jgi:hypothetical protein
MLLPTAKGLYVDVGTAAQTILLAAHSLGLGAGIVTSFSRAAVGAILTVTAGAGGRGGPIDDRRTFLPGCYAWRSSSASS